MRYEIEYIPKRSGFHNKRTVLVLCEEEIKYLPLLLPILKKKLIRVEKKCEYYEGIHEAGEASSRQQISMINYQDECCNLKKIIKEFEKIK